ncbi:MAG: dephospho-CoA kinase [Bacteroidaceae bacterium]|nr:dephospho-CoA kinase [Bacteroidaceae bacterium]
MTLENKKVKIGITGGIGSDKTYICNLLRERGYKVYNCDDEAKQLMLEDAEIISQIKTLIGNDAYTPDGQLNKPVIANFIFSDKDNAAKVNGIVHPAVKKDFLRWAEGKQVAIMESAILFESGFDDVVDTTVLIWADARNRLKRAMTRDHATREQIEARMAAQISDDEARRKADYIFRHNNYDETENEMRKLIQYIENYS